ncbi:excinuclease ABC subunit C [bacterium]|nr:excinuclease ABC subunit C [bacterium]
MNEKIREKLDTLPELPGSYQMLDENGTIIYVGKAKNLKNRVRSYFVGAHNNKTSALVSKIDDLRYIVTSNEREAFLLEISLIKEYNPFYNIDLTDDKTYPYIEFTNEKNPKLIVTRNLSKKNNRYFGPYTNVVAARKTMELLNQIYKLRKCNTVPKKTCIYYEMGECMAPCINEIKKEEYDKIYKEIKGLLYGNELSLITRLKEEMNMYSSFLDFENAKKTRDLIDDINKTLIRQDVVLKEKLDADIYGITYDESLLSLSLIYLRGGKIILSKNDIIPYYFDLEDAIINSIIKNYELIEPPKYIFIEKEYNSLIKDIIENTEAVSPLKGTKHNLLLMAKKNSEIALENKNKIQVDKKRLALIELSSLLNIPIPNRIESFDNSNLFGDSPVSSCVVYIGGRKAPKEYRKYHIKSIIGPNDYGTMREVTYRRYKRIKEENLPKPDLILIDGGETQVKACLESLKEIGLNINVAGMKKDDTHSTNTLIFKDNEYELNKHSNLFKFLFEVQEEVHRFAITFHRTIKEKSAFTSVLDEIKGVGESTKEKLLSKYKTIDAIKEASDKELKELGINDKTIISIKERLNEEIEFE